MTYRHSTEWAATGNPINKQLCMVSQSQTLNYFRKRGGPPSARPPSPLPPSLFDRPPWWIWRGGASPPSLKYPAHFGAFSEPFCQKGPQSLNTRQVSQGILINFPGCPKTLCNQCWFDVLRNRKTPPTFTGKPNAFLILFEAFLHKEPPKSQ